jgi:hypothetical protein
LLGDFRLKSEKLKVKGEKLKVKGENVKNDPIAIGLKGEKC